MLRPYGGDRVRALESGALEVVSSIPKGWTARRPKTLTSAEFPGSAIEWDGEIFEVVVAAEMQDGRSTYTLRPWAPNHAIRVKFAYNAASERDRAAAFERMRVRRKHAFLLNVGAFAGGHLPAHVQLEIESEYGVPAVRATLLSIVPMIGFAAYCATRLPINGLPGPRFPPWVIGFGLLALSDSLIRLILCIRLRGPCGSIPGLIAWEAWKAVSPRGRAFDRRASARSESNLKTTSARPPSDYEIERDSYLMREPYLAFLSPGEQRCLHETFGFDPIKWGYWTAGTVAAASAVGLTFSGYAISLGRASGGKWVSMLVAATLLVEQVARISALRAGNPAGSILGALVRPWCRRILSVKPKALVEGSVERKPTSLPDVWEGDSPDER